MNNRGWGLNEMIILCIVLLLALFVSYYLLQGTFKQIIKEDYTNTYLTYERNIEDAAKKYVADTKKDTKDTLVVTLKTLKDNDYIKNIVDPDNQLNCSGYVAVKESSYNSYLKCSSNYETSGYSSQFDE